MSKNSERVRIYIITFLAVISLSNIALLLVAEEKIRIFGYVVDRFLLGGWLQACMMAGMGFYSYVVFKSKVACALFWLLSLVVVWEVMGLYIRKYP